MATADDHRTYSIRQLCREFGATARALRFYEDKGLLTPARKGQTRVYDARDRARLKLILRGRRIGFTLQEIQDMLDLYDRNDGNTHQMADRPASPPRPDRGPEAAARGSRRRHRDGRGSLRGHGGAAGRDAPRPVARRRGIRQSVLSARLNHDHHLASHARSPSKREPEPHGL